MSGILCNCGVCLRPMKVADATIGQINSWWAIAWPIALALSCRMTLNLTDVSVLGHVTDPKYPSESSADFLGAASLAQIWTQLTSSFVYRAFGVALNTLSSQARGGKNFPLVGVWLQLSLWVVTLVLCFSAVSWWFVGDIFTAMKFDRKMSELAGVFARWFIIGLFPMGWYTLLRNNLESQRIVFPCMIINIIMIFVNLFFNFLLVFGDMVPGWSGLHFIGSPIATSLTRWISCLAVFLWAWVYKRYNQNMGTWTGFSKEAFSGARVSEYLCKQSAPLMVSAILEELQLQVFVMMAAHVGPNALAAHSAMLNLMLMLISVPFGLGKATAVRIGFLLGSRDVAGAKFVAKLNAIVTVASGAVIAILLVLLRKPLGHLFSNDPNVVDEIAGLSHLVGIAFVLLCGYFSVMGILEGQGRPAWVMAAFFLGMWGVGVTLGFIFTYVKGLEWGLEGIWTALIIGYLVTGLIEGTGVYLSDWDALSDAAVKRSAAKAAADNGGSGGAGEALLSGHDDSDAVHRGSVLELRDEMRSVPRGSLNAGLLAADHEAGRAGLPPSINEGGDFDAEESLLAPAGADASRLEATISHALEDNGGYYDDDDDAGPLL